MLQVLVDQQNSGTPEGSYSIIGTSFFSTERQLRAYLEEKGEITAGEPATTQISRKYAIPRPRTRLDNNQRLDHASLGMCAGAAQGGVGALSP